MRRVGAVIAAALLAAGCGEGESDTSETATLPPVRGQAAEDEPAAVGGPPTVDPGHSEGEPWRPPPPTVIAAARTARGDPFELVLYGTKKWPCYAYMYPGRRFSEGGGGCGDSIILRPRPPAVITGSCVCIVGEGERLVTGYVSPEVEAVRITIDQGDEIETLDATTEQIPTKLLEEAGIRGPRGVFIAFPAGSIDAGNVTATAYDADGAELGSTGFPDA